MLFWLQSEILWECHLTLFSKCKCRSISFADLSQVVGFFPRTVWFCCLSDIAWCFLNGSSLFAHASQQRKQGVQGFFYPKFFL